MAELKKTKGISSMLVAVLIITLLSSSLAFADGTTKSTIIIINNRKVEMEQQPIFMEYDILVPVNPLIQKFDLNLDYSEDTGLIKLTRNYPDTSITDLILKMGIDSEYLDINNESLKIIAEPKVIDEVVYIPLKALVDAVGAEADYGNPIHSIRVIEIKYKNEKSKEKELGLLELAINNIQTDAGVKINAKSEVNIVDFSDQESSVDTTLDIYGYYDEETDKLEMSFVDQTTSRLSKEEELKFNMKIAQYRNDFTLLVEQNGEEKQISLDLINQQDLMTLKQLNNTMGINAGNKMVKQIELLKQFASSYKVENTTIEKLDDGQVRYTSTIDKEKIENEYSDTFLATLLHYDEIEYSITSTIDSNGRLIHLESYNSNLNDSENNYIKMKKVTMNDKISFEYDKDIFETNRKIVEFNKTYTDKQFPDSALESAITQALGEGEEFENITKLEAFSKNIVDLEGIQVLTNLEELDLSNNQIKDISALEGLTNLKVLNVEGNEIEDYSVLEELENVEITK